MPVPIEQYEAFFDQVNNKYGIKIKAKGGLPVPLRINTETEFVAILLMLSKSDVVIEPLNGVIAFPPRPTGT